MNTKGGVDLSGLFQQSFATSYNGQTSNVVVDIQLLEVDGLDIVPPSENRVLIAPGSTNTLTVVLHNTGTSSLSLTPTLSGLPSAVDVTFDVGAVDLDLSEQQSVVMTFAASTGATPGTSMATLTYLSGSLSVSYTFDVVVVERERVAVNTVQDRLLASPASVSSAVVDVTNLGTASDVYLVEWTTESQGNWFEFTLSPTRSNLTLGRRNRFPSAFEKSPRAHPMRCHLHARVVSTTNSGVHDEVLMTVQPVSVGASMTVLADADSAAPGGSVYGTLVLTNTGNTKDTFSITTVGVDCGLDVSITVAPGLSTEYYGWSCVVPNNAEAGQQGITFRAVSGVRSNVVIEQSTLYTVEAIGQGMHWLRFHLPTGVSLLGLTAHDHHLDGSKPRERPSFGEPWMPLDKTLDWWCWSGCA